MPDRSLVRVENLFKTEYISENVEIVPKCSSDDLIPTIGADGIFYPCDWLRNPNTLYKSQLWKQKSRWLDKLHISNTDYDRAKLVINDWANFVQSNSLCGNQVDVLCKMKCRKGLEDARLST